MGCERTFSCGRKALAHIIPGISRIRIRFRDFDCNDELTTNDICSAISRFCMMNKKILTTEDQTTNQRLLSCVCFQRFENDEDRTVEASVCRNFLPELFAEQTDFGVESIVVINPDED